VAFSRFSRRKIKATGGLTMGRTEQLNLIDIPWPLSILRCNCWLNKMLPGAGLRVLLNDPHAKDNLTLLLNALDGYTFTLDKVQEGFLLRITRDGESYK
jgi:TusA-related sulfurtransferase